MKVPFFDRTRADELVSRECAEAFGRVMRSGQFIMGAEVEAFERECADYLGAKHAIGVSSGTDALLASLMALGVGPGDEVIVPAFTFVATATVVVRLGARPVFVDVESDGLTMDPASVAEHVTGSTKAVIPVHLFGYSAGLIDIRKALFDLPIAIIEDSAQSFGLPRAADTQATCHSFFPTKNLGGFGDGGLVETNDDALASVVRALRVHGSTQRYQHQTIGGNFRLDAMQAALLCCKLRVLDGAQGRRARHAHHYFERLSGLAGITLPPGGGMFNQFVIRVADGRRDQLRAYLTECGVGTEVYYPMPLHLQPCFAGLGYDVGDFPVAEQAANEVLALPIFPELTAGEVDYVCDRVQQFAGLKPL